MAYFGQNVGNGASIDPQVAPISPLQLAQTGYYNSLSGINRQNMPIQAQDAANRNALSQQAIQTGQMALDEKQQQQADSQFAANAFMKNHSTTTDAPVQTPSAPITSAGPVKLQPPQVQSPGLSSLLNPNALTANQSQVMQGQNPTPSPVGGMATPASGTLKSPFPPVSEADLLGHLKGAVQTSASQNPMAEGISSTMAKIPNGSDTTSAVGDNPHFAATHTFDSVNPTTGQITHNTFNRQGYLDELASNPRTAGLAAQLESQWTAQDAGDQLTKAQAQVAKTSQLLGMVSSVANAAPEHQQAAFNFMLQQAEKQGLDVSSLKGTDLSTPGGQAKLDYLNKAAQADAATGAANLAVAKNTTDRLKANSEIGLQGAQASEIPSKIGLNNAQSAKAYADAAKTKQEAAGQSGSGAVSSISPQNQGIVDKLASGDLQLSDLPARTGPGQVPKAQYLAWTIQQHPDWNPSMNAQQKKTILDYAPNGTAGKALTTLGAVAEHTQLLRQSFDAMQNGDIPMLNKLAGSMGAEVGGSAKTTYNNMASVYAGEVDKAFSGNNPTEGGAKTWAHNLNYGMSPAQAKGAFDILDNAVVGKMQPYDQAYYNATKGKHLADTDLLTPAAKGLAGKFSPQAQTAPQGPAGASHPAAPQMQDGTVSASGKYIWHGGWVAR